MVSVIIPAYNAEGTIRYCLDSLSTQDYQDKYEIIVVDDGSSDSTPDIVTGYNDVILVQQSNAGPAAARNKGASEARGDVIIFTDSDCVPRNNWISEMVKPFNDEPLIAGVKGAYKTNQKEISARFVQLEYEDKYHYMMRSRYIDFIDTYAACFKKDIFLSMGGYNTDFPVACAEDIELSYRLSNKGFKMVFNPNAVVYHTHPGKPLDYLKKKYKFAYWRMLALKLNPNKAVKDSHTPQMMKLQLFFPPLILISFIIAGIYNNLHYLPILLLLIFLITTIPFIIRSIKSDFNTGILSPVFLLLRSSAQFWSVWGISYILWKKK